MMTETPESAGDVPGSARLTVAAVISAVLGALCAANADLSLTSFVTHIANGQLQVLLQAFNADGGILRGVCGASFGLLMGISFCWLAHAPASSRKQNSELGMDNKSHAII